MGVVAVLLNSCASVPGATEGQCQPFLLSLSTEAPEDKAESSVASGRPFLLAVKGFTLSFPGANELAAQKIGYQVLEGTSDSFADKSCQFYQRKAEAYAKRYNTRVLQLLSRNLSN